MIQLTMASLFAGIGGFELSATWVGIKPIWSNEIDPWCCKVLRKNFNHEIIEKDIRLLTADTQTIEPQTNRTKQKVSKEINKRQERNFSTSNDRTRVIQLKSPDILTGGFPCQPFSHAGKRKGKDDNRYLWPEYLRLIGGLQPPWIIAENVAGLISMENGKTLKGILIDLENENYQTEIYNIPACGVGAWHKRERIWIICRRKQIDTNISVPRQLQHSELPKGQQHNGRGQSFSEFSTLYEDVSNTKSSKRKQSRNTRSWRYGFADSCKNKQYDERIWEFEPNVGRVANGIPGRVDRLKGLGNAIYRM